MREYEIPTPPLPAELVDVETHARAYARAAIEAVLKRSAGLVGLAEVWRINADEADAYGNHDRAETFRECAAEIASIAAPQPTEPAHADGAAVDAFAAAMKEKLAKKRAEGRSGWRMCSAGYLSRLLREHVDKGDPVDVANLAMMLSQNGQRIEAAKPVKCPICFEGEPHTGTCGSNDPKALCNRPEPVTLGWRVRERRGSDGELLDCFVEAPAENGKAYGLEVLGDDYTGYGDIEGKLKHCQMIVAWANADPVAAQPDIRALIADDTHAMTFQSMGQYRTALLQAFEAASPAKDATK